MKFELDYIEKLVNLVSNSQLTELALEDGNQTILLKREKDAVNAQTVTTKKTLAQTIQEDIDADFNDESSAKTTAPTTQGTPILSPMVGTFYCAPAKDAEPFVKVGDIVSKGQVVCIIEAMKLMNEIEAEVSGKITKILVENGQPVEYGQVLMYVE